MKHLETIYIQLLDEGTLVWRPTVGEYVQDFVYRVLPTEDYNPENEEWEFLPGHIVRCEKRVLMGSLTPEEVLVAVQAIE